MLGKKKLNSNIFKLIKNSKYVIDIVYNPLETEILIQANKYNVKNIGGLKMLIEQAKPSFEKWSNKKVTIDKELFLKIERKLQ